MIKFISKTIYIEYLDCPKNTWLKLHKPELKELFEDSTADKNRMQQGNMVESLARKLFPDGIFVKEFSHNSTLSTDQQIKCKSTVLFQTIFIYDAFLVRVDILEYDSIINQWNLYEIKSTSSTEENSKQIDHIEDASFQAIVLEKQGIILNKIFLLHLNKEYVLEDQLDINHLFIIDDITQQIREREKDTLLKMEKAKNDLLQNDEEKVICACIYRGRSTQCKTFNYSYPYIPEYSVHDLSRIGSSKKKLATLVNSNIFKIDDIPQNFELSEKQNSQINAYKKRSPSINYIAIKQELDQLEYPLYFFDYETYAPAIPLYKGFYPYQQIPVQFSLHVAYSVNDTLPIHFEYLHELETDPSLDIIKKLKEFIDKKGTIIVWHKSFEKSRNSELAERHPEYKEFLDDINNRIYDLKDIFNNQMYVDAKFKGSSSIKKVLPVLAPELCYKRLNIQEGLDASQKWFEMIYNTILIKDKQRIANDLRQYCHLDTYAMYAIWKYLIDICNPSELIIKQKSHDQINN